MNQTRWDQIWQNPPIEIGDVLTFGTVLNGKPAGSPFVCVDNKDCLRVRRLQDGELVRYQQWKASGEQNCFSLRDELEVERIQTNGHTAD